MFDYIFLIAFFSEEAFICSIDLIKRSFHNCKLLCLEKQHLHLKPEMLVSLVTGVSLNFSIALERACSGAIYGW